MNIYHKENWTESSFLLLVAVCVSHTKANKKKIFIFHPRLVVEHRSANCTLSPLFAASRRFDGPSTCFGRGGIRGRGQHLAGGVVSNPEEVLLPLVMSFLLERAEQTV